MKKLFFAILSLVFVSAQAQTVDEVINKYITTMGGLDAFKNLKTAKMTGKVLVQGLELPITIQVINGRAVRSDVDAMGQSVISSYKDGKGWKINPFAGFPDATDVTDAELPDLKAQTMLTSQIIDYKAQGHKVELLGQEDVDGIKTNKVKLTNKDDSRVTTYFISVNDNSLVKSVSMRENEGQQIEVETFYSNVKEYNGAKFAMTRVSKVNGDITQEVRLDKMELNVTIDEKVFDK